MFNTEGRENGLITLCILVPDGSGLWVPCLPAGRFVTHIGHKGHDEPRRALTITQRIIFTVQQNTRRNVYTPCLFLAQE
jgi:hypothetical protein